MTDAPTDEIEDVRSAHHQLLADVADLTDDMARQPSLLPDWSVGHVLSHIARNADSLTGILEGCIAGEHRAQYPGGAEQRNGDIEAGAGRPAAELVADVAATAEWLEAALDAMTPEAWAGHGLRGPADALEPWPAVGLPFARRREVEVYHADLGLLYTPADWPDHFVDGDLPWQLEDLPDRLDGAGQRALLAWILGRAPQPDLELAPWQRAQRR